MWGGGLEGPSSMRQLGPTGKAHLRRALLGQEAALQLHAVCRALRREDLLQAVLARALRRCRRPRQPGTCPCPLL